MNIQVGLEVLKKGTEARTKLSRRAGKLKRKAISCLLFIYLAGLGSLKDRKKIVYCLFIQQGLEVLKERQKFVNCLFIQQGLEVLKERQKVVIVCVSSGTGKFKREAKKLLIVLSGRAENV